MFTSSVGRVSSSTGGRGSVLDSCVCSRGEDNSAERSARGSSTGHCFPSGIPSDGTTTVTEVVLLMASVKRVLGKKRGEEPRTGEPETDVVISLDVSAELGSLGATVKLLELGGPVPEAKEFILASCFVDTGIGKRDWESLPLSDTRCGLMFRDDEPPPFDTKMPLRLLPSRITGPPLASPGSCV
jgi:hypothetical protein